jgi:hypothetical protein
MRREGMTPLHLAMQSEFSEDIAEILNEHVQKIIKHEQKLENPGYKLKDQDKSSQKQDKGENKVETGGNIDVQEIIESAKNNRTKDEL